MALARSRSASVRRASSPSTPSRAATSATVLPSKALSASGWTSVTRIESHSHGRAPPPDWARACRRSGARRRVAQARQQGLEPPAWAHPGSSCRRCSSRPGRGRRRRSRPGPPPGRARAARAPPARGARRACRRRCCAPSAPRSRPAGRSRGSRAGRRVPGRGRRACAPVVAAVARRHPAQGGDLVGGGVGARGERKPGREPEGSLLHRLGQQALHRRQLAGGGRAVGVAHGRDAQGAVPGQRRDVQRRPRGVEAAPVALQVGPVPLQVVGREAGHRRRSAGTSAGRAGKGSRSSCRSPRWSRPAGPCSPRSGRAAGRSPSGCGCPRSRARRPGPRCRARAAARRLQAADGLDVVLAEAHVRDAPGRPRPVHHRPPADQHVEGHR